MVSYPRYNAKYYSSTATLGILLVIGFFGCGRINFENIDMDSGGEQPQEDASGNESEQEVVLPGEDASGDTSQLDSQVSDLDSSTTVSNLDSEIPQDAGPETVNLPDVEISDLDSETQDAELPSCSDEIENGSETDVDCGGPDCPPCDQGMDCIQDEDCLDGLCDSGVCETASCQDGVMNQDEEDVDCGGVCDPCPCSSWGPFSDPERITGLGLSGNLYGPSLSADGLTMYLAENTGSDEDIYVATRSDRGIVFSAATSVPNINSSDYDGTPFISSNGLTIYFYTERPGGLGIRDIMSASRSSVDSPFDAPTWLTEVNSNATEHLPMLTQDELVIIFDSDRPGGEGDLDLWIAERGDRSDAFSSATNITELNSPQRDTGASLLSDGLTIFFSSSRPSGQGGFDIWFATRTDVDSRFSSPENLTVLNSSQWELDPSISEDGEELLFSSNRTGKFQIWRSTRECL
jgi:Tol biopolymer transport system component